jgi:hypothetical protein
MFGSFRITRSAGKNTTFFLQKQGAESTEATLKLPIPAPRSSGHKHKSFGLLNRAVSAHGSARLPDPKPSLEFGSILAANAAKYAGFAGFADS